MESSTDAGHPDLPEGGERSEPGSPGAGPAVAPATALRWWRVFSPDKRELSAIRRWLESLLPECPARHDVISVATELGSNALVHTASGRGGFAVEVTWYHSVVRVAVADRGGPAEPRVIEDADGERGRGPLLVRGLSERTGVEGDERGRTVWAEIGWDGPDMATVSAAEAAITNGEAALARSFPGVPAWFGRSTREWWALPSTGELVAAPTAAELAKLLHRMRREPVFHGHR